MKTTICLFALFATALGQYSINYQYNQTDSNCAYTPNAVFANIASGNSLTGSPCYKNPPNIPSGVSAQSARKSCNPSASPKTITYYYYSDDNCTIAASSSNNNPSTQSISTTCFTFNSSSTPVYSVIESVDCTTTIPTINGLPSVTFTFYNDAQCNNFYGEYSYQASKCQIAEGGYQFVPNAQGFTFYNYPDTTCAQASNQNVQFTGNNVCSTLSQGLTFAPTLYYKTSSTSSGPFAGTGSASGTNSASGTQVFTTYVGSTTHYNSAASVVANIMLIVAAIVAMMTL